MAASNLALQLLGFAYRILLSRLAGPEGMGVYTLVMQVYTIVISVCLSGMSVAVTNLGANLYAKQNILGIRRLVRCAICCFLLLFAFIAAPVIVLHDQIAANILGDPRTGNALWMVLCCIFLTGFENIMKAAFHAARLVRYTACSEVGEQVFRIIAVIALLTQLGNEDYGRTAFLIISGMTISEVYSVLFLSVSYWRCFLKKRGGGDRQVKALATQMFRIALPATGTAIICNLFSSVATLLFPVRLMAAGFARSEAVSALGVISGMVGPLMMLPFAFVSAVCTLLMPNISGAIAVGNEAVLKRKIDKGIQVTGLIAFPCTALLLPFIPMLSAMLFQQTIPVKMALLLGIQTIVSYYLMSVVCILNGMSKQKNVLLYAAIGEIVQLVLVYWLTGLKAWNVYGYIMGMICGDFLRVILGLSRIYRSVGLKKRIFSNYIVPLATAVILWVLSRYAFFISLNATGSAAKAMLTAFSLCAITYWLLLQMLGVHVLQYIKRIFSIPRKG